MLLHPKTFLLIPAVWLAAFSSNAFAGDLFDMLKRMSEADQNQNYQGIFILRKADNLSTLRVTHGVDDDGEWESLESLNGEAKKMLRHNNRVITVFPNRKRVAIRQHNKNFSLHQQLPANIEQLESYYSIERLADDRIANHEALVISLTPKDKYRYGYHYWIDKNTGMLLRCDLLSVEKNSIVEQMMFTSLDYLADAPEQLIDLKQFESLKQIVPEQSANAVQLKQQTEISWKVADLPKGFMLTQNTMRFSRPEQLRQSQQIQTKPIPDLQHMVYSDGLASVSIFIEKNRGKKAHLSGSSTQGAVNAFGNAKGDYYITVVGEVPEQTVQAMAQSISRAP